MKVRIALEGVTPLLQHNEQLADPLNDYVRKIKLVTDKRSKMTEDDHLLKSRLEWEGGLYFHGSTGPYVPTLNVIRCFIAAGTVRRLGTKVAQAVAITELEASLQYSGPRDVEGMWAARMYDRRMVGVNNSRVQRTRPMFQNWALSTEVHLFTDILSLDDFKWVVDMAGRAVGLGDGRRIGMGRFNSEVVDLGE
jgi:hypothetical protein